MLSVEDSPAAPTRHNGPIPEAPLPRLRYLPEVPFPPYRYVPGLHPHPVRDPAGHSYQPKQAPLDGRADQTPTAPPRDDWRRGVDLFNAFYFWEAHEAWEKPWRACPRGSAEGTMLQGLIQIAAALFKVHLGSAASARRLATEGLDKLDRVAARHTEILGVAVDETKNAFRTYFGPLDERTLPPLDATVPPVLLVDGPRP